ncbi:MAG: tetratricopeptide repeat-containing sensor histidine kinase [Cytophagales bacterium]|nr:tetratricopeptide repeat-containing sensor histidine kinase [Bernardetiaceae bacterium]MDW8203714.1 tetratricopeptide repeat-containing sensor histidine kinase [Cytophagales bacterium]
MNWIYFVAFIVQAIIFVPSIAGQDQYAWENEPDIIHGYYKFIAAGGDYDTLSPSILERLVYKANASYYGPKLVYENFGKNHLLAYHFLQHQELSEAKPYAQIALRWATKISDNYYTAAAFRILSDIYYQEGRLDSSLHYKTRALMLYQQLRNQLLANIMYYQIGTLYYTANDYDEALYYFVEFFKRDTRANLVRTLQTYNYIGRIYHFIGKHQLAIGYFQQAATIAKNYGIQQWLAISKGNVGKVYVSQQQYQKAIPLLEMSYLSAIAHQDTSLAIIENSILAEVYWKMRNRSKMELLVKQIEQLYTATINPEARLAYMRCRYLFSKAKADWQEALKRLEIYKAFGDSLNSLSYRQSLEQVRMLSITAIQPIKEELMSKKIEASERQKNWLLWSSFVFLSIVTPFIFGLWRLNLKYKKTNLALKNTQYEISLKNRQLEEQNKQIALQAANLEQVVKQRTRDLQTTINVLNSHNKDLEQFSYIISHNIRSPITQILGLVNIFNLQQPDDPFNVEILKNLQKSAASLDQVIKDLNTIISTRQGLDSFKEKVELEELLRQVLLGIETNIAATQASIQYDFTLQPVLYTIRGYMHSILYNLISNAIKYRAEHRKPHIVISSDYLGNFCTLTVADNGLGMDLQNIDTYKIFGLYQRMHTHTEGKGLGLYLVKTQVESLGGTISVESQLGEGSVFRISLPLF